jgi:hypothetical protein
MRRREAAWKEQSEVLQARQDKLSAWEDAMRKRDASLQKRERAVASTEEVLALTQTAREEKERRLEMELREEQFKVQAMEMQMVALREVANIKTKYSPDKYATAYGIPTNSSDQVSAKYGLASLTSNGLTNLTSTPDKYDPTNLLDGLALASSSPLSPSSSPPSPPARNPRDMNGRLRPQVGWGPSFAPEQVCKKNNAKRSNGYA